MNQMNRMIATIIGVLLAVNSYSFGQHARYHIREKKKPIPLADLQNPDSPSYVPIPYPKTREEVIIDFKYYLKRRIAINQRNGRKSTMSTDTFFPLYDIFNKKPKLKVGKVYRAKNLCASAPDHYFFFDITDSSGKIMAKIAMRDTGHFASANPRTNAPLIPVRTLEEVLPTFKKKAAQLKLRHNHEDIQNAKLEYVIFAHGICRLTHPLVSITIKDTRYYLDFQDHLFVVANSEPLTRENVDRRAQENYRSLRLDNIIKHSLKDYLNRKLINIEELN